MGRKAIILNSKDNVATALTDLALGEIVEMEIAGNTCSVKLVDAIPFGHKFSLINIKADSTIIKYGEIVGKSTIDIQSGQNAHIHNVASIRARGDLGKEVKK